MRVVDLYEAGGQDMWGIHFSKNGNLKVLRANKWNNGDGLQGAERQREQAYPEYFVKNRIYFYIYSASYQREAGLGAYEYKVKLTNLYDWDQDPRNFFENAAGIARAKYVEEYTALMKKSFGTEPDMSDDTHYDYGLAQTIMERLIKKAGYNGYFSRDSNNTIVYFYDVRTGIEKQQYGTATGISVST